VAADADARRERWLGVELRHLAALVAVAQEGTFRRAADELGYVQSAVSQQISFLERTVGTRLVERSPGPGPVALTEAGRILVRHAHEILARLRAARADVDALADSVAGTVRIGLDGIAQLHVLPDVLLGLGHAHPDISVLPSEVASVSERLELVERGMLDLAFVDLPIDRGPFETCEVLRDVYVLMLHVSHPLAHAGRPLQLSDLTGLRLAVSPLRGSGGVPTSQWGGGGLSHALVQTMVESGHCEAIVPARSVRQDASATTTIDLGHLLPPHVLGLCWHADRELRPAVQACVAAVSEWRATRAHLRAVA
jgi:DNA-binding transcriptional LysR family regulator